LDRTAPVAAVVVAGKSHPAPQEKRRCEHGDLLPLRAIKNALWGKEENMVAIYAFRSCTGRMGRNNK